MVYWSMNIKWAGLNQNDWCILSWNHSNVTQHKHINTHIYFKNFYFCAILLYIACETGYHASILSGFYSQFVNMWYFSGKNKHLDHTNTLKTSSFGSGCYPVAHNHLYKQNFHPGKLRAMIHFKEWFVM